MTFDNPNGHTWWTTTGSNFKIYTDDPNLIGTANEVAFTDVSILTNSPTGCDETVPLIITLINPCETTIINDHTIADINIILDESYGNQLFDVGDFTDTVSQARGPTDGITYCGTRNYSFDKPNLVPYAVDNIWKLQALNSDGYTGGTEIVTVTVTLEYARAATVSRDFTFNVIITCVASTITS